MKKLLLLAAFGWFALAGYAADSFLRQLTPAERTAAGLDQLTPEQQKALDALAERYVKEGSRAEVAKVREETQAEVEKAREQTKVEVAKVREESQAEVAKAVKKHDDDKRGFVQKENPKVNGIESRIAGEFRGWQGRTLFKLENGQQWVQTDEQVYRVPAQKGPDVEIVPSALGGWKLWIQPEGRWVRVKRVQ